MSIDNNSTSSTDTFELPPIDTSTWISIDTNLWADMVATLGLIQDGNWDLHDQDSYLHNASGQRLDDQGVVISDPEAANLPNANAENVGANGQAVAEENVQAARPISLADYNRRTNTIPINLQSVLLLSGE